jgi:ethanolamine ammonia-lyase small subunit
MSADSWSGLRRFTPARIALGRAGGSRPTQELLAFRLAHAAAIDAVHAPLDMGALRRSLEALGLSLSLVELATAASDGATYLQRPDFGRRLDEPSRRTLATTGPASGGQGFDVSLIVADGLSAAAAQENGPAVLGALIPLLRAAGRTLAPVCLLKHGRVGAMDEIGAALSARVAVILLGERPGLQTPSSLGAYLVFGPRPGRTDAERNCLSNIRADGLVPGVAAQKLAWLVAASLDRKLSGVALKDEADLSLPPPS